MIQVGQGQVVPRRVTGHLAPTRCVVRTKQFGLHVVDGSGWFALQSRKIVGEHEDIAILRVDFTVGPLVAGTQIAVGDVPLDPIRRNRLGLSLPRTLQTLW